MLHGLNARSSQPALRALERRGVGVRLETGVGRAKRSDIATSLGVYSAVNVDPRSLPDNGLQQGPMTGDGDVPLCLPPSR